MSDFKIRIDRVWKNISALQNKILQNWPIAHREQIFCSISSINQRCQALNLLRRFARLTFINWTICFVVRLSDWFLVDQFVSCYQVVSDVAVKYRVKLCVESKIKVTRQIVPCVYTIQISKTLNLHVNIEMPFLITVAKVLRKHWS